MTNNEQYAFKALADPTRRQILLHLSQGDKTIGELVNEFSMTRAAVKKHLDVLSRGQMVSVHPRGRERINRLQPKGIKSVMEWLGFFDQFWDEKLNALKEIIENDSSATPISATPVTEKTREISARKKTPKTKSS